MVNYLYYPLVVGIMGELVTIQWVVEVINDNPDDSEQYLKEAKGGRMKLCQQDATKELQVLVNSVEILVQAYRGQGFVPSVALGNSPTLSINCGPMKAHISITGEGAALMLERTESQLMKRWANEQ